MVRVVSAAVGALCLPLLAEAAGYDLVKQYQGSSFFDGWKFQDTHDTFTNGRAQFLNQKKAQSSNLAYVNSAGNAIMRVDNTTTGLKFGDNRNSIRIETNERYTVGSVWVVDMLHVPHGCSVWPAFWSHALVWPTGGEIDTFEAVNAEQWSHAGLHTNPGCAQVNPVQTSTLVNSTDCNYQANNNEGCITTVPDTKSYGEAFSQAGGGVWVTEYANSGISVWFFSRSNVPSSISSSATSIDTSQLGKPFANYPTVGCDMTTFFGPQTIIFDITLCGDYAGNDQIFAQTCPGVCYQNYVLGDGSAYNQAYFEVSYLRVYGTPGAKTVVTGSAQRVAFTSLAACLLAGVSALAVLYS